MAVAHVASGKKADRKTSALRRWFWVLRQAPRHLAELCRFYWYHRFVFGITNTKFDISYCVFQESFIRDQYGIREFLDRIKPAKDLFFLDLGRNHGFVFYYTLYYIHKKRLPISAVNYVGVDPSPLKFVYYNLRREPGEPEVAVGYTIIDRAVVFDGAKSVNLKYGERNFGNFNVSGSNYADKQRQAKFEFVELNVETIGFAEILELIRVNMQSDALIIKIDCKNRTEHMFLEVLNLLRDSGTNYLVSCEQDGSAGCDLSRYARAGEHVLSASNVKG